MFHDIMSSEELEVEVEGKDEKDGKRHRKVSEFERGYRVGHSKGQAFVWRKLGVRPSEFESGKVKVTIGDRTEVMNLGDESAVTQTEKKETEKKQGDHVPILVGIFVAVILGLLVYHFVFGKRNQPENQ